MIERQLRSEGCSKRRVVTPALPQAAISPARQEAVKTASWPRDAPLSRARPQQAKQAEVEVKVERRFGVCHLSLNLNLNLLIPLGAFSIREGFYG